MKRRFFAILLTVCLLLTMTPAVAMAAGNAYVTVDEIRNLDGSVTTIETNKIKGTVTEETHFLNGTILKVVKEKDGTVTSTERDAKDNIVTTVELPDGTVKITQKPVDGMYVQTETVNGVTTGIINIPFMFDKSIHIINNIFRLSSVTENLVIYKSAFFFGFYKSINYNSAFLSRIIWPFPSSAPNA